MVEKPKAAPATKPGAGASFVARLVPDAAQPPDLVVVGGYVGESCEPGCIRLYLGVDLRGYIEIPDEDVVYQAPIPGDPWGGSYLWVRRHAKTRFKRSCDQAVSAREREP
ncbi:MAG TPA: hypothetical protein VKY89_21300 [Thermoanaerobaculia bacterium]|nr:hypothetical protein [Thermoanaerobaculia bacterium]